MTDSTRAGAINPREIEEFLYEEAMLLDNWDLMAWLKLFAEDGHYLVPSLDLPRGKPSESLFLVFDDMRRLTSRVNQLLGRAAWAENPPSRTRHMVSNVLVRAHGDGIRVLANFVVYRLRHETVDTYMGRYEHFLVRQADGWKFRERKAIIDLETLRPQGKISVII